MYYLNYHVFCLLVMNMDTCVLTVSLMKSFGLWYECTGGQLEVKSKIKYFNVKN